MDDRLVIGSEVERREDGLLVVLHYEDGGTRQFYMLPAEARDVLDQLTRALDAHSAESVTSTGE